MRMGLGLLMATLGAILRYAVDSDKSDTVNLSVIGLILMIIGAIGFITSALLEFAKQRALSAHQTAPLAPPPNPQPPAPTPPRPQ